jgi:hypothetical protein
MATSTSASSQSLCPDGWPGARPGRFDQGLYGCSEMFVNGFLKLIEAGIIRREVFGDAALQQLHQRRPHRRRDVTPDTLRALMEAGRIGTPLSPSDLAFLTHYSIFKDGVKREG